MPIISNTKSYLIELYHKYRKSLKIKLKNLQYKEFVRKISCYETRNNTLCSILYSILEFHSTISGFYYIKQPKPEFKTFNFKTSKFFKELTVHGFSSYFSGIYYANINNLLPMVVNSFGTTLQNQPFVSD